MISPLADPRAEAVLSRLHAEDARQLRSIVLRYLPRALLSRFGGGSGADVSSAADRAFLRDKLVALDADKGRLAYTYCRALDARQVVEVGTSFGVSTIYLAAALRDNAAAGGGERRLIGTEIEPVKVRAARANLAEAGLADFAEIREGDALLTLKALAGPVDFLLIDTWIPLALPALELLKPRLRPGAIVMCDNVRQFAREYRAYTDYVRDPRNGFRSMLWPKQGGVELSVRSEAPA
ncbi:O-methyltransferase [Pigmentiphaga humi]|uniref:O-methyltransferase n=1 Tax=Pigmentiphaga humi TaxID=2478468 RepID=A0A3P4AW70_9BURK|nr:class I SAM-dependent methyltransferase [Pigmentiphaga humi]VCU67982.1 O-methyltransferase [Pigmentiphaga humi]